MKKQRRKTNYDVGAGDYDNYAGANTIDDDGDYDDNADSEEEDYDVEEEELTLPGEGNLLQPTGKCNCDEEIDGFTHLR